MKARMKMVYTALAVVGLASGAMAGRGSRRLIEKRTGSQELSGNGTAYLYLENLEQTGGL